MDKLSASIKNTKEKYREIFSVSATEIEKRINDIKPAGFSDIFGKYELDTDGYIWQQNVLKMLDEDISKEIYRKWKEILDYRSQFGCIGCGTCCKLACSEFSPEQLKEKALNGDKFASQFLSVFVPYPSKEDARKIYPEYIRLLEDSKEDDVYFYHCPKLNKDNRCYDYENRPQICRDFPDNPLALLPKSCGFQKWKEEIEPITLMLHSMLEIVEYYKEKLKATMQ